MRILDNPALDVAIEAGNLLGLPVVVYFQVNPNSPNANLRHYHFLAQGLRNVAEDAASRLDGPEVQTEVELQIAIREMNPSGSERYAGEREQWRSQRQDGVKQPQQY